MAEITKEQFKVVGKNTKTMESISPSEYWLLAGCMETNPQE